LGASLPPLSEIERDAVQIRVKYEGYIQRAEGQVAAEQRAQQLSLAEVAYGAVEGLSNEGREKLIRHSPATLAQASRMSGVRHADISALLVHLKRLGVSRET
jgi:tRNA uridine 5-carboxymethylaminomethyl modification enzyme